MNVRKGRLRLQQPLVTTTTRLQQPLLPGPEFLLHKRLRLQQPKPAYNNHFC